MPAKTLPADIREPLALISEITFCNPFMPRRVELEKKLLGKRWQPVDRASMTMGGRFVTPNVPLIMEMARALAEQTRAYASSIRRSKSLSLHYRDTVAYFLYQDTAPDLDKLLETEAESDSETGSGCATAYKRFVQSISRYFPRMEDFGHSHAHTFESFYQLRRAHHHVARYMIGRSQASFALRARVWQSIVTHDMRRFQRSLYNRLGDVVTLITGPSGSGKELVARAIGLSRFIPYDEEKGRFATNYARAFYPLNLSTLSPTLLESELFGSRKGSFTGALQDRVGYFEACGAHGTVFLDEIGEITPEIQVKLLRVLQVRQFQRLGDTTILHFRGKLMAATNRDLAIEIEAGRMREDFYYRICSDQVNTPSLRMILDEDYGELGYLVRYIAGKVAGEGEADSLGDEVLQGVERNLGRDYAWPGNFRELEQCVKNFLIHGNYRPSPVSDAAKNHRAWFEKGEATAQEMLRTYTRQVHTSSRSIEETARRLDLDRRTVKKYLGERDTG